MKFLIGFTVLFLSFSVNAKNIEKKYFVKGMHCGGCESGVRMSLIELGKLKDSQIVTVDHTKPDAENQIGHIVVRFDSASYKGKETDCRLAKAIKKNPGYDLYWDSSNTNPCGL